MSEKDNIFTENPNFKLMFGGVDPDSRRKEAFYEENFPAMEQLFQKGVRIYQVTAQDFLSPIAAKIKDGRREEAIEIFKNAAIVCQLGDDRSKKVKLMAMGLGATPALTVKNKELLAKGVSNPRVGMGWNSLGTHADEGTINESGELVPDGFEKPITRVIGFVDAGGARQWSNADLDDPNLFSKLVNHLCKNEGVDQLNLEVIIVEGTSNDVDQQIAQVNAAISS